MANKMADEEEKNKQQQVDTEELTPELRGVIIDAPQQTKQIVWIGIGTVFTILAIFCSWAYVLYTRTDTEILREQLKRNAAVKQMLMQANLTIERSTVTVADLEQATGVALDVVDTPLRIGKGRPNELIPERHYAIIAVLEGLLRLDLAMGLDASDDGDYAYWREALDRLGRQPLEYYENGLLIRRPLLRTSTLRQEIRFISELSNHEAIEELTEKKAQLEALEEIESFTVAAPALLLGKWYRYHNDTPNAQRCFEMGRQCIEGLRLHGEYYPGHRPKKMGALWDEYVGCLEGLMEIAFENGHYREAQSYLVRMFNTPDHDSPIDEYQLNSRSAIGFDQRIQALQNDITILERAVAYPLELPTFPLFSVEDDASNWKMLTQRFKMAGREPGRTPLNVVWEGLDTATKKKVVNLADDEEPTKELISNLTHVLNELVQDPSFTKRVAYTTAALSPRAQKILSREQCRSLSKEELLFLNRDIIDSACGANTGRTFILSDGTRLHNALQPRQVSQLISLYEEKLSLRETQKEERIAIRNRIEGLYSGDELATIQQLYNALEERRMRYRQQLANIVSVAHQQESVLTEVRQMITTLDSAETLDLDALIQYKEREGFARERQIAARIETRRIEGDLSEVEHHFSELTTNIQQHLIEVKTQLAMMHQHGVDPSPDHGVSNPKPQIAQIERQIDLNTQYKTLLEELVSRHNDSKLQRLFEEFQRVEETLEETEKKLSQAKGNEREHIQEKIDHLSEQRHLLLSSYNALFDPLRDIVKKIASEEEQLWEAERRLLQAREECLEILGTDTTPGTLEEKTRRRTSLLLMKPDDIAGAPLYEAEIRQLTKEIASEHARLHILLDAEKSARQSLAIAQPDLFITSDGSENQQFGLSGLKHYLDEQDGLIQKYVLLWRQRELEQEIVGQESLVLNTINLMITAIDAKDELSESQTEAISRLMQQLLHGRNRLTELRAALQAVVHRGAIIEADTIGIAGRGYLLDNTELFQMEHRMGLNLKQYRNSFEERTVIVTELREAIDEKDAIERKKLAAARRRDQVEIDRLLPLVSEQETVIHILSNRLIDINAKLRLHAADYKNNYVQVEHFRNDLLPQAVELEQQISDISQQMASSDTTLKELAAQVFSFNNTFQKTITTLDTSDLGDIDTLVSDLSRKIEQLQRLRDYKLRQHYYQAKALWLMGLCFYEQSQLTEFLDLVESSQLSFHILEDEHRFAADILPEFDQSLAYSDTMFGQAGSELDQNRVNHELWIDFLERATLDIFQNVLPKYVQAYRSGDVNQLFTNDQQQDNNLFIAKSQFLSGQIHMRRSLRSIRASHTRARDNKVALSSLSAAGRAFDSFVEFVSPLLSRNDTNKAPLSEKVLGAQEFPNRKRQPVTLIDSAYIYLGIIATLKDNPLEAIGHYREMLTHLSGRNLVDDHSIHDDALNESGFDPELVIDGHYQYQLSPYYVALLAHEPLTHEILYRLGSNYQLLAEEERMAAVNIDSQQGWIPPALSDVMGDHQTAEQHRQRFRIYSQHAIAYYSQLILTQSFSPYRTGAILRRAHLARLLDHNELARNDLISILGDPDRVGGSWEITDMTAEGDLPGELNPSYAYVAFELGKLYLETGDYLSAAETFLRAKLSNEANNAFVVKARIAYANALRESGRLALANLFLSELVLERTVASRQMRHLYPEELSLDLADVQRKLGNLNKSIETAHGILSTAPRQLIVEGKLHLSDKYGMRRLQDEFRDAIRPLARYAFHCGGVHEQLQQYDAARTYYKQAATLYRLVPWRQDRQMRHLPRDEYENLRDTQVLAAQWANLRCDILELQHGTFAGFQKALDRGDGASFSANYVSDLIETIDEALRQTKSHQTTYQELLQAVTAFYTTHSAELPETTLKDEIATRRTADKQMGGQKTIRYDALQRIRDTALATDAASLPTAYLNAILGTFTHDSVEAKILQDFAFSYAQQINLVEKDSKTMRHSDTNISNLVALPDADKRLHDVDDALLRWLENAMVDTGLDDQFLPVSKQGAILEEVSLYRASLLVASNDFDDYNTLLTIADTFSKATSKSPMQIHSVDTAWQIVELAAMAATERQDWDHAVTLYRYLTNPKRHPVHITAADQQQHLKQAILAKSLIRLAQRAYENMVFTFDEAEKNQLEVAAARQLTEARQILERLREATGDSIDVVTARVIARQMREEAGV
ncbi:hypothetical protein SCG7086_AZ_00110 [Chlamydiales bacterium SCGC AG-110-P3]|nr:hypothetical protein SCG7086_AZ_00110 [Chlamydiales bacterium SCGC AG-110-P3]